MDLRPVFNGDYFAGDDGLLYKEYTDGSVLPEKIYNYGRSRSQASVVIGRSGERHTEMLSHIIAEAFGIEHPEDCVRLIHLDGDGFNNRPENLKWVSQAEFSAHRLRFYKKAPCSVCGKLRVNNGNLAAMCFACKAKQRSVDIIKSARAKRANRYASIPVIQVDFRALDFLPYLKQGYTLDETAQIFGCSKQNVCCAVKSYTEYLRKEGYME